MSIENKNSNKGKSIQRPLEELYSEIANNMTDVVWTTDMNLNPTYCTPSVKKYLAIRFQNSKNNQMKNYILLKQLQKLKHFKKCSDKRLQKIVL